MTTCTNGPCWTATTLNTGFVAQSSAIFNNLYIAGGSNSSNGNAAIQYSSDGVSWTTVDLGNFAGYGVERLVVGNGLIFGMLNAAQHVLSSDGINWTAYDHFPPFSGNHGASFVNGYFVFRASDDWAYSTDGINWSATESAGSGGYMNGINAAYGGGMYVTCGTQGFAYTTDITIPLTTVPYASAAIIAYGAGVFVAIQRGLGSTYDVFRSTDGINWTTYTAALPATPGETYYVSLLFEQDRFVACKSDSNQLAISSDGITWTLTADDSTFDAASNGGQFYMSSDSSGTYLAVNPFSNIAQIGVCPCTTPIVYGDYWAKLSNVTAKNVSISRWTNPNADPYYNDVVLLSNMSSGSGGSVITNNMVLYVDATNGLTPVVGNTTLSGNAPVVDNYFDFNGFAAINIENPNLYNVSWASGKTILVAAQFNSGFNEPGYRALLGATGEFGLLDRIVNLYLEVLNPPPYSGAKYRLAFSAGGYGTWSADLNIAPNSWFIFGVTHSPDGTVKFYVNGYQVPNLDPGATQPLTGFNPGTQYLGRADNYWWGKIGYWQVYNTALTSQQVLQNYKATANNFPGGNTLMIDESKYSNQSKIYYAGSETFNSYLITNGGPINNGNCWKASWGPGFANRIVYYDSIPQFAMPADFTIEAWIYNDVYSLGENDFCLTGSTGIDQTVWSINTSSSSEFVFISNQLKDASNPSADLVISNPASAGQWHHVAVVRSGNTVKIYVDGTQSASQASKNVVPGGSIPECKITALGQMQSGALPNTWMQTGDYLGPFRITVGVARYTGPFTPPTDYFPTQ